MKKESDCRCLVCRSPSQIDFSFLRMWALNEELMYTICVHTLYACLYVYIKKGGMIRI